MGANCKQILRQFRVYFIAVVVMAAVWGVSFATRVQVAYNGGSSAVWVVGASVGEVWVCRWLRMPGVRSTTLDGLFDLYIGTPDPHHDEIRMFPGISALGFFAHHSGRGSALGLGTIVIVPFWFIGALVLGVIAWIRYRMRRRRSHAQGFPTSSAGHSDGKCGEGDMHIVEEDKP